MVVIVNFHINYFCLFIRTAITVMLNYCKLCLRVMLDSLSCPFTSI